MTQADRDLVTAIRAELAAIDPSRPCDRVAESIGLGPGLSAREASVARLAVRLGRETADAGRLLTGRQRAKHVRLLDEAPRGPDGTDGADAPAEGARGTAGAARGATEGKPIPFDWEHAAEHCRIAYLRGRFLARGSVSFASSRVHLEFVVPVEEAPVLSAWLADLGWPASWRVRRGRGVVTWKSVDKVATFLRTIGAGATLLELESRQVTRMVRGDLNRVINAESANLHRSVAAAGRQLAAIDRLEADGRLGEQPYVVRLVAEARRETPESTLGELAERLSLHRSAVQRALERIEQVAFHGDDDAVGRRGGREGRRGSWHARTRDAAVARGPRRSPSARAGDGQPLA